MADSENCNQDRKQGGLEDSCSQTGTSEQNEENRRNRTLRSAALSVGPDRENHLANHPLNQRPVSILTNAIKEAFLIVSDVVRFKRLGCAFLADFRSGKSTALEMIAKELTNVFPGVACELVSAIGHDAVTERVFFGDLLVALGLPFNGTAQERYQRLRAAFITACSEAGGRHFTLLIDEGQNWGEREFTFLRDFSNQLRKDRYVLTTVIFGDLRLNELAASFRTARKDLWARFLMKPELFACMRSVEDLKFFMSEHDNVRRSEYPSGSKVCYSEFFLPRAYANGWRLGNEAQNAWEAFERAAAKVNRKLRDIGMQWVGDAVTHFLTAQMSEDVEGFTSVPENWDEAVNQSKFTDSQI